MPAVKLRQQVEFDCSLTRRPTASAKYFVAATAISVELVTTPLGVFYILSFLPQREAVC